MCSKAPHGTTPTLTSAIKISSQTATYINSRHYSLSWLITQSENKVSWHHKVSQGPTRSHKVAQGLTRSHKVSQGLKRSHKAPQGLTRSHKATQGLKRGFASVFLLGLAAFGNVISYIRCKDSAYGRQQHRVPAWPAGHPMESQHGLLVVPAQRA